VEWMRKKSRARSTTSISICLSNAGSKSSAQEGDCLMKNWAWFIREQGSRKEG